MLLLPCRIRTEHLGGTNLDSGMECSACRVSWLLPGLYGRSRKSRTVPRLETKQNAPKLPCRVSERQPLQPSPLLAELQSRPIQNHRIPERGEHARHHAAPVSSSPDAEMPFGQASIRSRRTLVDFQQVLRLREESAVNAGPRTLGGRGRMLRLRPERLWFGVATSNVGPDAASTVVAAHRTIFRSYLSMPDASKPLGARVD